jgi:hypothetical protein
MYLSVCGVFSMLACTLTHYHTFVIYINVIKTSYNFIWVTKTPGEGVYLLNIYIIHLSKESKWVLSWA